jgi:hypothetical protein
MVDPKYSETPAFRDRDQAKFLADAEDKVSVRVSPSNRGVAATPADFLGAFNPMGLPLLPFDSAIEVNESNFNEEFPLGVYFIKRDYIQYRLALLSEVPFYSAKIYENNILLLDGETALKLDATNGNPVTQIEAFTDIFLELE